MDGLELRNLFVLIITALMFISCAKESNIPTSSTIQATDSFVSGKIIVGLNMDVDVEFVFNTVNKMSLKVVALRHFVYEKLAPADGISDLIQFLNTKTYINTYYNGFKWEATTSNVSYVPSKEVIRIDCGFYNIDSLSQRDLMETIINEKFVDSQSNVKSVELIVPVGMETVYRDMFKRFGFVRYAELITVMKGPL